MIAVDDGAHLWSERFDRELTDIFEVQDEITAEIVKALHGTFAGANLPTKSAVSVEAYNAYLRGLYHFNRNEFPEAIEAYRTAIAQDASCAEPHVGLALAFNFLNVYIPGSVGQETACDVRVTTMQSEIPLPLTSTLYGATFRDSTNTRALPKYSSATVWIKTRRSGLSSRPCH